MQGLADRMDQSIRVDCLMRSPLVLLLTLCSAGTLAALVAVNRVPDASEAAVVAPVVVVPQEAKVELPPVVVKQELPAFAEWPEFRMVDLFKRPVGPLGLEYTDEAKALDGKQVRILGFQASTDWQVKASLLLTPYPIILHDKEYGQADDVPIGSVYVKMPGNEQARFTPGLLMLAGTLRLGRFEEHDGRHSYARLELDPRAKDWQPSPSLLSHRTRQEREFLQSLVKHQKRCGCKSCS